MCSNCPCEPCDCWTPSCHQPCERNDGEDHDRAELESRMRDFEDLIGGSSSSTRGGYDEDNFEVPRIQSMDELEKEIEALKREMHV